MGEVIVVCRLIVCFIAVPQPEFVELLDKRSPSRGHTGDFGIGRCGVCLFVCLFYSLHGRCPQKG